MIRVGRQVAVTLEMHHETSTPEDVIPVVVVSRPEAQRLVELACPAYILRGENGFWTFVRHRRSRGRLRSSCGPDDGSGKRGGQAWDRLAPAPAAAHPDHVENGRSAPTSM